MNTDPLATLDRTVPIVLIGGGGHARVVADSALEQGLLVGGFADDDPSHAIDGVERLGGIEDALRDPDLASLPVILAVGPSPFRDRLMIRVADRPLATVVHPRAIVSRRVSLEPGVFVGPGAIVNAGAHLWRHSIVNSGAVVEHDCVLGVGAHACPRSCMAGGSSLGERAMLGAGAVLLPGVSVGAEAVVGASSLVNRDVPSGETCAGVPARALAHGA